MEASDCVLYILATHYCCWAPDHGLKSTAQDGMERRLSQKMNQLEVNCNANIGEGVAAGIEEVRASILETGKAAFPAK